MKLITVIMGQDCQDTIGMCLKSVKGSDEIIYLDGGSTDRTLYKIADIENQDFLPTRLFNKFDKKDPNAISKQRNFYLDYLKKNYKDVWVLVLDADEVLETDGINKIKELISSNTAPIISPRMRHLMYNLTYEDATQETHFVPNRLFRLEEAKEYPQGEHTILNGKMGTTYDNITIWHLGYLGGVWDVKKRFDQQALRNNGHNIDYLKNWNKSHMLGQYPVKKLNPVELPNIILDNFGIDKDELYFNGRGIEVKHFIDAKHWKDFFKCETALEFGCGLGVRVYAMETVGIDTQGIELSEYAVKNNMSKNVMQGDITKDGYFRINDLVVAYDLLEHISYDDLDKAINNLIVSTNKHILVSVPVIGDPNLENDPTHIIKETKEWWIKQFTDKGLKEVVVPEHFLFRDQLMIFKK